MIFTIFDCLRVHLPESKYQKRIIIGLWLHNFGRLVIQKKSGLRPTLREKCPYSELFWFVLSRIRTEYSVRMRGKIRTWITPNTDTSYVVPIFQNSSWKYYLIKFHDQMIYNSRKILKNALYHVANSPNGVIGLA